MVDSIRGLGNKISDYYDGKTPATVETDVTSIAFTSKLHSMNLFPRPVFSGKKISKAEDSPFVAGLMKGGNIVFAGFCATVGLPFLVGHVLTAAIINLKNSDKLNNAIIKLNELEIKGLEKQINDLNEQVADSNINLEAGYLDVLAEKKTELKNKLESYNELQHETEMLKKSGLTYLQEGKSLRGRINEINDEISLLEQSKANIIDYIEDSPETPYGYGETPERRAEINQAARYSNEGNAQLRGKIDDKIENLTNEKNRLHKQLSAKVFNLDSQRLDNLEAKIKENKKTLITSTDNFGIYYEKVTEKNVKQYLSTLVKIYEAKSAKNEKFISMYYGKKLEDPNLLNKLYNSLNSKEITNNDIKLVEYVLKDCLRMRENQPKHPIK